MTRFPGPGTQLMPDCADGHACWSNGTRSVSRKCPFKCDEHGILTQGGEQFKVSLGLSEERTFPAQSFNPQKPQETHPSSALGSPATTIVSAEALSVRSAAVEAS